MRDTLIAGVTIQKQFTLLIRCGLWESIPKLCDFKDNVDWNRIVDLARQQTMVGVMTEAMVKLPPALRPPKPIYFNAIATTSEIEKENKRMNAFASLLMGELRKKGVDSLLLKGQGVGQCYPNPLHRQSGDIDLLITDYEQYRQAKQLMAKVAEDGGEAATRLHSVYTTNGMVIELHGNFRFSICPRCSRHLQAWTDERLSRPGRPLSIGDGETIQVPPVQFDAVFIFGHMLQHYMTGGVGLRQIADWMLFVSSHVSDTGKGDEGLLIDVEVLKSDLEFLGLMKFWKYFAALAVDFLGCPKERMPFYEDNLRKKGELLLDSIFKTGNFGTLQKEKQMSMDSNKWVKKIDTAIGQLPVYWRTGKLFPKESVYCFLRYARDTLKGG